MLRSIGKVSKSLLLKIFVGIIILPFIFWGMGDVFRGGNQNIVATIDSSKISTQEFINFFNRLNISDEEKKNINNSDLVEKVLSEFIGRKIIELEIENLGIKLTDSSLRDIIKNDDTFLKDNKFSRTTYEKFLIESGLSAPDFEQNIAAQEKKRQLLTYLSEGILIPDSLVKAEYQKENQSKNIDFINLENYYKNFQPEEKEIEETFEKSKQFFIKEFKKFNFVNLKPKDLVGNDEYNEKFFDIINQIESRTLDGESLKDISDSYKLSISTTEEINNEMKNIDGTEIKKIDKKLFEKIIIINDLKSTKFIDYDNKYFLVELISINTTNKDLNDQNVKNTIITQINFKNRIEHNIRLANKIKSGNFKKKDMIDFAQKNSLKINSTKLETDVKDPVFNKKLKLKIFRTNKNDVNLVNSSDFSKSFLVFTKDTQFKEIDKNSEKYNEYKLKAKLDLSKDIYGTYDISVNNKYKIELNNKTIKRIKNSF